MAIMNGKALAEARRKKGLTQIELSEATKPKVDVSTISRIERGKSNRIRPHTLNTLAQALDVAPDSLCPRAEAERETMKLRVEAAARNAFTLVARRYGVSREQIVESAPLLFFIAAEQSLKQRQEHLACLRASADALTGAQHAIPHMTHHWPIDEEAFESEERSIKERDLFGTKVLNDSQQFMEDIEFYSAESIQNPFVRFLRDKLVEVGSTESAESVSWPPSIWPSYEICADEAAVIVGGDTKAARAILCGAAALHEMPKGSPQQRAEWAQAEFDREYGDISDLLGVPPESPNANDQEPSSGEVPS